VFLWKKSLYGSGLAVPERRPEMKSGYFNCGLPYARIGCGSDSIVLFDGLGEENKAPFKKSHSTV